MRRQRTNHEKKFRQRVLAFMEKHNLKASYITAQIGMGRHEPFLTRFLKNEDIGMYMNTEGKIIEFMERYEAQIKEGRPFKISQGWVVRNGHRSPVINYKPHPTGRGKRAKKPEWMRFIELGWMQPSEELKELINKK